MKNKVALFASYILYLSSAVMVMISLMNPSIDASLDSIFTARGYAFSKYDPLDGFYTHPGVGSYVVI